MVMLLNTNVKDALSAIAICGLCCIIIFISCSKDETLVQEPCFHLKWVDDEIVYDNGTHAAFTGMIEYEGDLFLAFREGEGHASGSEGDYGTISIMKYLSGGWKKMWSINHGNMDLRDPFFAIINGKLRLYSGFNNFDGPGHTYQHSGTAYSDFTGNGWTEFLPVTNDAPHIVWIWKIREFKGCFYYGVGYLEGYKPLLMKSVDGTEWKTVSELNVDGIVSEADLNFIGDSLYICLRRDTPTGAASYWGVAQEPFQSFEWNIMDKSIACPEFFQMKESTQTWLTGREYIVNNDGEVINIQVPVYEVDRKGNCVLVNIVRKSGIWDLEAV